MNLLRRAHRRKTEQPLLTKSGLMVGLGETVEELLTTFRDLSATGCEILTVGQYLAPTPKHIPIECYYTPEEFALLRAEALAMGFRYVESGPLVRSSYHAGRHAHGAESADYGSDGLLAERLPGALEPHTRLVQLTGRARD
jgi:lipoic acid synthetase